MDPITALSLGTLLAISRKKKKRKKKNKKNPKVHLHYHSSHRGLADLNRQQANLQRQINKLKNGR